MLKSWMISFLIQYMDIVNDYSGEQIMIFTVDFLWFAGDHRSLFKAMNLGLTKNKNHLLVSGLPIFIKMFSIDRSRINVE